MLSAERLEHAEAFGASGLVEFSVERRERERLRLGALPHGERGRELDGVEAPKQMTPGDLGRSLLVRLDGDVQWPVRLQVGERAAALFAPPQNAPGPMYGLSPEPASS